MNKTSHDRAQDCLRLADEAATPELKRAWERLALEFEREAGSGQPDAEQSGSHPEVAPTQSQEM